MLEYIWGSIFILVSLWFGYIFMVTADEDDFMKAAPWLIGSWGAGAISIVLTWGKIGYPIWMWLVDNLPQKGEAISTLTAFVLACFLAVFYVVGLSLLGGFGIKRVRKSIGRKAA